MLCLFNMSEYDHVSKQNKFVLEFYSNTCAPCKQAENLLSAFEKVPKADLKVYKINVENPELQPLVQKYGVMSVPTIVFMKDNQPEEIIVGLKIKELDSSFQKFKTW